jgi:thiamine-monophosphate kinase
VRLSDVGEQGLLGALEERALVTAIEDDAASLGDGLVVTQDSLVEGVHFRLDWLTWRDLGYRAAAVNVSDLAASGARPRALLVSIGVPAETAVEDVLQLYEGLAEAGVPVRGGDTTESRDVFVTVTAVGDADRVPGRGGARPGDALVVTGPLGGAGAAFRERRFVRPPLRVEEGVRLARHAHAMLDVSDGLAIDAARIARRSGCRLEIDLDTVPLARGATVDDLGFGEDFELLAATPEAAGFAVVGSCRDGVGVVLLRDGHPVELGGWSHFRRDS